MKFKLKSDWSFARLITFVAPELVAGLLVLLVYFIFNKADWLIMVISSVGMVAVFILIVIAVHILCGRKFIEISSAKNEIEYRNLFRTKYLPLSEVRFKIIIYAENSTAITYKFCVLNVEKCLFSIRNDEMEECFRSKNLYNDLIKYLDCEVIRKQNNND